MTPQASLPSTPAVIDIGSNSVRLVIFRLAPDAPPRQIHSEKSLCQLGRDLALTGCLYPGGVACTIDILKHYQAIAREFEAAPILAVATAAVREASDGPAFLARVRAETGVDVRLISGEEEARLGARGVLAADPEACGIVADLGGGSLELARVADGDVHETVSLPLGGLKLLAHAADLDSYIDSILSTLPPGLQQAEHLYTIGGSWRVLSHTYLQDRGRPRADLQGLRFTADMLESLAQKIEVTPIETLCSRYHLELPRGELLPLCAHLLVRMLHRLSVQQVVLSTAGIRDGILRRWMDGAWPPSSS